VGRCPAGDMVLLFSALETAVKRIAFTVRQAAIADISGGGATSAGEVSTQRDAPKPLDLVANEILKDLLAATGLVAVMASEEDDDVIELSAVNGSGGGRYAVVFDPLDGSRNIECSIPTGTIFGIYCVPGGAGGEEAALQAGSQLVASGYALYSSATMVVATLGGGRAAAFTLDATTGDFLATHPTLRVPPRGQIYSLNDARYWDWPEGLQRYIDDVRQGRGQNPKQYSARYVCSLVADLHRTIVYGGWCGNPRSHLRLVYEAAPLAFLVEHAGGSASDGVRRILDIKPTALHQRLPLFLGSRDDIAELCSYGDVQQTGKQKYDV